MNFKFNKIHFSLLIFSACVLCLELVHMRLLAFMYWNHIAYIIITIAMLGFAASGVFVSISLPKLQKISKSYLLAILAFGFSISTILGMEVVSSYQFSSTSTYNLLESWTKIIGLFLSFVVLALPYFFGGTFITILFTLYEENKGFLYFLNLIGSGLGCLLFVILMKPFGAPALLIFICFIVLIIGFFLVKTEDCKLKKFIVMLAFLLVFLLPIADQILPLKAEDTKGIQRNYKLLPDQNVCHELTLYNPTARVDVVSDSDMMKNIYADGDAWTPMFNVQRYGHPRKFPAPKILKIGKTVFLTHPDPQEVLVIGSGGGHDLISALYYGAKHIDAIDINSTTVDLVKNHYNNFLGGLFRLPEVSLYNLDGRTFVQRTDKKYDLGLMTGVDTFSALSTGAYILSESYIYTINAFEDYLRCLTDDGVFSITTCYGFGKPREIFRIFATALTALRNQNIQNPTQCVLMVKKYAQPLGCWGTLLLQKKPFTLEQIAALVKGKNSYYDEVLYDPLSLGINTKDQEDLIINKFVQEFQNHKEEAFYNSYFCKIFPVSDDKPFFFQFDRWSKFADFSQYQGLYIGGQASLTLFALLAISIILALVFIILPLVKWKRDGLNISKNYPWIIYFAGLGLGFMFFEMPLIQRFVLLLGHPAYSLGLTLPVILIFSGVGSLISSRWSPKFAIIIGLVGLVGIGLIYNFILADLVEKLIPVSLFIKILGSIGLIFPLAIFMGMFFPAGLKLVERIHPPMIPWAFGVNGSCSVVGSVLGVIGSMVVGFKVIGLIALGIYLIAVLSIIFSRSRIIKEKQASFQEVI